MSARPPLNINIWRNAPNLATARIISPTIPTPAPWAAFVENNYLNLQWCVTDGAGNYETLTGRTYRVGLGNLNFPPSDGTFKVSDGTTSTAALAYDIAAADFQTALNGLNGGSGPYGVQVLVTGGSGAPFTIVWQANGSHAPLTVDVADLSPACVATVNRVQVGSVTQPEIQQVRAVVQPFALNTTATVTTTYATCVLAITSAQLAEALQQNPSLQTYFEIEETDTSGDVSTILQAPVTVNGVGLPPNSTSPSNFFGSQWFTEAITNGNSTQAIVFPQTFSAAPTRLLLSVIAPDATNETLFAMAASVTATGFTLVMNGAPSVDGYTLSIIAAP